MNITDDRATRATAAGMVVAAVGITTQFVARPEVFPPVPPGPFLSLAAAAVVALVPRWWAPLAGVAMAAFLAVGGVVSGGFEMMAGHSVAATTGQALMVAGIAVSGVAGVVATVARRRRANGRTGSRTVVHA